MKEVMDEITPIIAVCLNNIKILAAYLQVDNKYLVES